MAISSGAISGDDISLVCGHGWNVSDGKFFVGHISGGCMSSGTTIIVIHLPRTTIMCFGDSVQDAIPKWTISPNNMEVTLRHNIYVSWCDQPHEHLCIVIRSHCSSHI